MEKSTFHQGRKPNLRTWICPICNHEMNSRGAPAHLRNKHGTSWKRKYLNNPKSIRGREDWFTGSPPYLRVKEIFANVDYREDDISIKTIDNYYKLALDIKIAMYNNNKTRLAKICTIIDKALKEYKEFKHPKTENNAP